MKTKEIIKEECAANNVFPHSEKTPINVFDKKKAIVIGILILTMLLSIFAAPFVVDKLHIIDKAGKTLDDKKDTVIAVTATAATISVAVGAIPGDSTTALSTQIAELDIFFIIVLMAIYILKILLVASTPLAFKFLFPAALLLLGAHYLSNIPHLKNLAMKAFTLGLVILLTVPISVGTMNVVDAALRTQEKVETVAIDDDSAKTENEDKNWWVSFWNNITDKVVNATKEMYQKAKDKFSELVDIVASLIITCCVIPLLVIVFLAWILKMLFGLNISTKSIFNTLHGAMSKGLIKRTKNTGNEEDLKDFSK